MFSKKNYFTLFFIYILFLGSAFAQNNTPAQGPVFSGSIEEQFDVLLKNSYPYANFKKVRDNLPRFKKNTLDSVKLLHEQITAQNATINNQQASNDSLNQALDETKELLSKGDTISFLGLSIEKGTYHFIVWSIIIVLAILLLFFVQRYKSNSQTAKDSRDAAEELREEFEQHRKKAMEREQKLKRDLQDELNKAGR